MLRRSLCVLLAGLALAAAASAGGVLPVEGRIAIPDTVQAPSDWEVTVQLDSGKQLATGVQADGRFAFAAVPTGVHMLEVAAHGLVFPSVRLDVGVAEEGEVTAKAADMPGTPQIAYPLRLVALGRLAFFEQRAGFSLLGFLKTPYGMMIGFMFFSLYVMPKLKVSEEEYKEMAKEKDKLTRAITGRGGGGGGGGSGGKKDE